jgi:hypothetical protein
VGILYRRGNKGKTIPQNKLFYVQDSRVPTNRNVVLVLSFYFLGSLMAVLRIRIRIFLGLPDPDPLVRQKDPAPDLGSGSFHHQAKK